jgi:stage III sporulation protein AE
MKRLIWMILFAVLLSGNAKAVELPEELTSAVPEAAEELLKRIDVSGTDGFLQGLARIAEHGKEQVSDILSQRMQGAAAVLLVVILCGAAEGFCQSSQKSRLDFLPMVGALSVSLLTAGSLDMLIGLGTDTIRDLTLFSKVLLPTLAAATATSGAVVTATVQQVTTVFLVDVLLNLISSVLIPVVYFYIGTLTASCCIQDSRLATVAEMLRKVLTWVLTMVLMGFTAYLSMVQIVSGAADGAQVKLTRSAISGVVPVVGKIIADAAETVLIGAGMLKNTVGIFGMLAIFAVCIHPFLQLGVQYLLYKFTAFLSGVIGPPGLCKLIDGLGSAFGLVLGMTGACALLLLVSVLASVAAVVP